MEKRLSPNIRVGQNGLSESTIIEIKKHLKQKKLIKIKFLKNFIEEHDKKEAVKELVQKTESVLIDFIGFVAVIAAKETVFGKNKKED